MNTPAKYEVTWVNRYVDFEPVINYEYEQRLWYEYQQRRLCRRFHAPSTAAWKYKGAHKQARAVKKLRYARKEGV